MIWNGNKEMVIGEVDDNGNVIREFRIKPGEEIPREAEALVAKARDNGDLVSIPYDSQGHYSKDFIEDAFKSGDPHKHFRDKQN